MPIPSTMRAWRKHKGNPAPVWEEVPVPSVSPTGLLVKLLASGVCHSDQALIDVEDRPHFNDVYTLGIRVALLAVPGCGLATCSECARNLPQLCPNGAHHGIGQDGFFAEFVAVDQRAAVALPDGRQSLHIAHSIDESKTDKSKALYRMYPEPEIGAVATDAVLTAYHGIVRRAQVKSHETVFLFGLGGLGFNALQIVLSHIKARVIVSDVRREKLLAARELGVRESDIVPVDTPVTIPEFIASQGIIIDTVLEFVGKRQTFSDAQKIVRPGGKILCIGTGDRVNDLDMKNGIRKRLSFLFNYGGQKPDLEEILTLIKEGVLRPRVQTGSLKDFPTYLRRLCAGEIEDRVALLPK
ncbi:hypothetical protein AN0024.2 [Aspergillus nidulans FGSC A4]|nr:hypothetical protein AN0024.2 [Aspergillus nidulans FGSC A4]|eukprot:XP_657628.1 hypothetical protein AN0024.2 [Aspergillus nidulans FGSC A4]